MRLTTSALLLCAATHLPSALASTAGSAQNATVLHRFPNGTSVENIAVRQNGNLLVTLLYQSEIHEIVPTGSSSSSSSSSGNSSTRLVHAFSNSTRVNGIAELAAAPDVFAVSANHDSIWTLDLRDDAAVSARKVATIPGAAFLNGVTALDGGGANSSAVLVADSTAGVIWRVDTTTGAYGVAVQDAATTTPPAATNSSSSSSSSGGFVLGVNGVRFRALDGFAYFTNTGRQLFCRVRVDPATGAAVGAVETLASGLSGDDFAFARDGAEAALVASGSEGVVRTVWFNGTVGEAVTGGVAGATAAAWGRGEEGEGVLFVTGSGGGVGGGEVVAVDLS